MRLASEEIEVTIGSDHFCLRPSLRAAFRLERRYEGFTRLRDAILGGSLQATIDLVSESAPRSCIISALSSTPFNAVMALRADLLTHLLTLAGIDPEAPQKQESGERITYAELHTKLFRIATGWLGWTPDQTWNATPAEIVTAYDGHLEMLRAIHGSAEDAETPRTAPDNSPLDSAGLQGLRSFARAA